MLSDALKVSEMRMARKKVAKEPGVLVLQLKNIIYCILSSLIVIVAVIGQLGVALDWYLSPTYSI